MNITRLGRASVWSRSELPTVPTFQAVSGPPRHLRMAHFSLGLVGLCLPIHKISLITLYAVIALLACTSTLQNIMSVGVDVFP